jgi:hypothetical protein
MSACSFQFLLCCCMNSVVCGIYSYFVILLFLMLSEGTYLAGALKKHISVDISCLSLTCNSGLARVL